MARMKNFAKGFGVMMIPMLLIPAVLVWFVEFSVFIVENFGPWSFYLLTVFFVSIASGIGFAIDAKKNDGEDS